MKALRDFHSVAKKYFQIATKAATKPLVFTLTSVTMQTPPPTPTRTSPILSLVSLEYSNLIQYYFQGIILSIAI